MNKKIKKLFVVIFSFIFVMTVVSPTLAAPKVPDFVDLPDQVPAIINYVALGDSDAAGVRAMPGELPGWEEGSDYGYTDLIAAELFVEEFIDSFNEDYSISGNTAAQLARDTSSKAYKTLVHADITTLTIGANDFLGPFYAYFDSCIENEVPIDPEQALLALKAGIDYFDAGGNAELQANMETILGNILKASPDVKIYVMGYYNPLPILIELVDQLTWLDYYAGVLYDAGIIDAGSYAAFASLPPEAKISYLVGIFNDLPVIPSDWQEAAELLSVVDLAPQVMKLNNILKAAIDATEAECPDSIDFIETLPLINGYNTATGLYEGPGGHMYAYAPGVEYLYADIISNPLAPMADIHLTEAGYEAVADLFMEVIAEDFDF